MNPIIRTLSAAGIVLLSSTATPWACGGGGTQLTAASYLAAGSSVTKALNGFLQMGATAFTTALGTGFGIINGFLFSVASVTGQPGAAQQINAGISNIEQTSKAGGALQLEAQQAGFGPQSYGQLGITP